MDEKKMGLMEIVGGTGVVESPEIEESFSLDQNLIPPLKACLKVKEAFNPNDLGDTYYETLED